MRYAPAGIVAVPRSVSTSTTRFSPTASANPAWVVTADPFTAVTFTVDPSTERFAGLPGTESTTTSDRSTSAVRAARSAALAPPSSSTVTVRSSDSSRAASSVDSLSTGTPPTAVIRSLGPIPAADAGDPS